jgi:hypothetical protein
MDLHDRIDVQCTKIANGLEVLKDVMGQPLACKVLGGRIGDVHQYIS